MSDIDDDGIPDLVEQMVGQDLIGPKDVQRIAAAGEVVGRVIDAAEQTVESVGGQAAVDAVGEVVDNVIESLTTPPVSMKLPEGKPARRVELTDVRDDASIEDFITNVLAQVGDRYQRGVDNSLRDANPDAWDGSELVEWGANRAGSMINDGAQNQYKQMVRHDGDVSVDVALVTPGAVLYEFVGDPTGTARPTRASTAISLGDGKHIIDIDPVHGVRIVEAKDFTFTHAGVMPGFVDSHKPGPMTHALVEDALKAVGLEPGPALQVVTAPSTTPSDAGTDAPPAKDPEPTGTTDDEKEPEGEVSPAGEGSPDRGGAPPAPPDTAEITALAGRAAQLRERYNQRLSSEERVDLVDQRDDIGLQHATAQDGAAWSKLQLDDRLGQVRDRLAEATELDRRAAEAQAAGQGREAEDLREQAQAARSTAKALEALAERSRADVAKAEAELTRLDREHAAAEERLEQWDANRLAAEKVIDVVEEKVRLLREAEAHEQRAKGHDDEAQWFRDNGDSQEADNRAAMAARARADADAARTTSRATEVDEATLRTGGILTGSETVDTVPPLVPQGSPAVQAPAVVPAAADGPQAATEPAPPGRDEVPAPRDPGAPQPSNGDEASALEARAQALRAELLERQAVGRADDMGKLQDLSRQELEAHAGAEEAKVFAQIRESQADEARKEAAALEAEAVAADKRGKPAEAEELREQAALRAAVARRHDANAREASETAARRLADEEALKAERVRLGEEYRKEGKDLTAAEGAIDQIETKARLFREAEGHARRAVDLESEAALLRDQGKVAEADAKHAAAAQARSAARQSETLAVAHPIDEAKISEAGLLGGPATTLTPDAPQASLLDDVTGGDATDSAVAGPTASAGVDADAHDGPDDGTEASADGAPDPTSADAPPLPGDEVIDAHATAASLVPDLPDASQVAAADDTDSDPWGSTAPDELAPTVDDDTAPDLEA